MISIILLVGFSTLVPIIVIIGMLINSSRRLSSVERRINLINDRLLQISDQNYQPKRTKPVKNVEQIKSASADQIVMVEDEILKKKDTQTTPKYTAPKKLKQKKISTKPSSWKKIEKAFLENWTGILGSVAVVAGVAFLAIYAAFMVAPFYRFLIIIGFSTGLMGVYYHFRSSEKWEKFANWLGSTGSAIFLFACLGASGIPGIMWIHDSLFLGLAFLILGIGVNFAFAYMTASQLFVSIHTVLSVLIISLAPPNIISLSLVTAVTILSILFSSRHIWDRHLIIAISSFLGFNIFWKLSPTFEMINDSERIIGMFASLIVWLFAALIHYNDDYSSKKMKPISLMAHLFNWGFVALNMFIYTIGTPYKTIGIGAAAIFAYFLAKKAKEKSIRWVYITDTMISQFLGMVAIASLYIWKMEYIYIGALIFFQSILFLLIIIKEEEIILKRTAKFFLNISAVGFIILSIPDINALNSGQLNATLYASLIGVLSGLLLHLYILKKWGEEFDNILKFTSPNLANKYAVSLFGLLVSGFIAVFAYNLGYSEQFTKWWEYGAITILLIMAFLRNRSQSNSLGIGLLAITFIIYFFYSWPDYLKNIHELSTIQVAIKMAPWFLFLSVLYKLSYVTTLKRHIKAPQIYLLGFHIITFTYFSTYKISAIIPGVIWIFTSIFLLEISHLAIRKTDKELGNRAIHILNVGLVFVAAFIINHLFVHLQIESSIGLGIKTRTAIELFAIGVFLYWYLYNWTNSVELPKAIKMIKPFFLELSLMFTVLMVMQEFTTLYLPIVWSIISAALLIIGIKFKIHSRVIFYSTLFAIGAMIQVSTTTSIINSASLIWYKQPWFIGTMVIIAIFIYLLNFAKHNYFKMINSDPPFNLIGAISNRVSLKLNKYLFYPFFISVAIFLYWRFDKSILSVMWVLESFMIFSLGMILRESTFRIISLSILLLCLIRLVFYDLSNEGTLERGLVFLGVGVIMILMNAIYTKYKDRFEDEK